MSRHYLFQLLLAAALTILCAATLNYVVDPFGWRPDGRFLLSSQNERAVKAQWIGRYPHDGLLIGTSKVHRIDPRTIPSTRLFNAAFNGARPEEILSFLERYRTTESLIVLGLDFFIMNETAYQFAPGGFGGDEPAPLYGHGPLEWPGYLASLDATRLSAVVLAGNVLGWPSVMAEAGNQITAPDAESGSKATYQVILDSLRDNHYSKFRYSTRRLDVLAAIKDWAAARGIRLLVFLSPMNPDEARMLRQLPAWQDFQRFRADMQRIFPGLSDFTDSYPDPKYYFPGDPFHYLPRTGTDLVREVIRRSAAAVQPR